MQEWLPALVWADYRVAVLVMVSFPLALLIWAVFRRAEAVQRLLIIYWRVASLLAITVLLMIAALPISYLTSFLARVLIPISLWFWVDLNDEIDDLPNNSFKLTLTAWRWGITAYSIVGALFQITSLPCALMTKDAILTNPACRIWLDAPWGFKETFFANSGDTFLGFWGIVGLVIYVLYLGHFVMFRLGKQGRTAVIN